MIKIKRGLNLPIVGEPQQVIENAQPVRQVALIGYDYIGLKPTMEVKEGDTVKIGQSLFTDKKNQGIKFVAPAGGRIAAINRGAKRVLESIVIDVDGSLDQQQIIDFNENSSSQIAQLSNQKIQESLIDSGLWTAFRTRPYSKVPAVDSTPNSIFVTAMDTNPLAADPVVIIKEYEEEFAAGVTILSKLTKSNVFVCKAPAAKLYLPNFENIKVQEFAGPHPAGLAGTHIHFLDPVSTKKTVWTIGYQDVIAMGKLFLTGKIWTERIIALAGPQVIEPKLIRTRLGASIDEITRERLTNAENRLISGSVLAGREVTGNLGFLGRYHNQITAIEEGRKRELLHYLSIGVNKFSVLHTYLSKLMKNKKFAFTSSTNGSERAMVPVGAYEKIMPLDILPTQLLRSLIVGDTEMAQQLGCLELDEEDLALCTFACPGKYEYGPILRDNLTRIETEG